MAKDEPDSGVIPKTLPECHRLSTLRHSVVLDKLEILHGSVKELTRAVRGFDSDPGMLGRLCAMRKQLGWLWALVLTLLGGFAAVAWATIAK